MRNLFAFLQKNVSERKSICLIIESTRGFHVLGTNKELLHLITSTL